MYVCNHQSAKANQPASQPVEPRYFYFMRAEIRDEAWELDKAHQLAFARSWAC